MNEPFASPLLNRLYAEQQPATLCPIICWGRDNLDILIDSYPEFEDFHAMPDFLERRVYRSNEAPSADAIRELCRTAPEREFGFYTYKTRWLIVVGPSYDQFALPMDLRGLDADGRLTHIAQVRAAQCGILRQTR